MRAMNVVVCVKQIPDPASPGQLDPSDHTLVRQGKLILDDSDAYGVEMGATSIELYQDYGGFTQVPDADLRRYSAMLINNTGQ